MQKKELKKSFKRYTQHKRWMTQDEFTNFSLERLQLGLERSKPRITSKITLKLNLTSYTGVTKYGPWAKSGPPARGVDFSTQSTYV